MRKHGCPYRPARPSRYNGEELRAGVCRMLACAFTFCLAACQKEKAEAAKVSAVNFYLRSAANADSAVSAAVANRQLTIMVKTDADQCTVWPAGDRLAVKSALNPQQDSVDVFGNTVLVRSDDYRDFGLTGARGKLMTGNKDIGYSIKYTYTTPGPYGIVIVAMKNGSSSAGFINTIVKKDLVVK